MPFSFARFYAKGLAKILPLVDDYGWETDSFLDGAVSTFYYGYY